MMRTNEAREVVRIVASGKLLPTCSEINFKITLKVYANFGAKLIATIVNQLPCTIINLLAYTILSCFIPLCLLPWCRYASWIWLRYHFRRALLGRTLTSRKIELLILLKISVKWVQFGFKMELRRGLSRNQRTLHSWNLFWRKGMDSQFSSQREEILRRTQRFFINTIGNQTINLKSWVFYD